jgi:hypothetical protein
MSFCLTSKSEWHPYTVLDHVDGITVFGILHETNEKKLIFPILGNNHTYKYIQLIFLS